MRFGKGNQPHCARTCFFFFLPPFFPASSSPAASALAGPVSDSAEPPQENPDSLAPPKSLLTAPLPYPKMVVSGFGAAGRAGKASSPPLAVPAGRRMLVPVLKEGVVADLDAVDVLDDPVLPTQLGCAVRCPAEVLGSAGNAAETGAEGATARLKAGAWALEPPAEEGTLGPRPAALPRRVLFFSRKTRVECFCWAAALAGFCAVVGLAAAAFAQPLDEVVAPCMPPRPGREG